MHNSKNPTYKYLFAQLVRFLGFRQRFVSPYLLASSGQND